MAELKLLENTEQNGKCPHPYVHCTNCTRKYNFMYCTNWYKQLMFKNKKLNIRQFWRLCETLRTRLKVIFNVHGSCQIRSVMYPEI